ncbi:MRPL1 [Mytilus edulis]|uniref:RP-L1 n=1 Tax=Mytilus edulis TaxID=6550 RepID=A0A8S3SEF2_MYTED|nr:MRPL1 [Mytilus edulis]
MAASIISSKMNTLMVVAKCMERRGVFPLMVIQKRFKGNKQKLKMKTDDSGSKTGDRSGSQKVLFPEISLVPNIQGSTTTVASKGKVKKKKQPTIVQNYYGDKPLDDVWISTHYPVPEYPLAEIIKRHKEYAQPAMFNQLDSRIYADMEISLRTSKKTKFLSPFKSTLVPPHLFDIGVKKKIIVVCNEKDHINLALKLGAYQAGGDDIVKMLLRGTIKRSDFDYLLSVPGYEKEWNQLQGSFGNAAPSISRGTISKDIEQMVKLYLHGLTYETVKTSQSLAKVQVPFGQLAMTSEQLTENFLFLVDDINKRKPSGASGKFISYMTIVAPPSPERFILNLDEYSIVKKKIKKESPVDPLPVDEEKVMQTAL